MFAIANVASLAAREATGVDNSVPRMAYGEGARISLDGVLDEDVWDSIHPLDAMRVISPSTLEVPLYRTETRLFYTEKGIYVGAVMEQPRATLVSRLSARDRHISRDSFGITLDPSGEGRYGFWFETTLGGSVMDGKVLPERVITDQWDGAWFAATALTADGWSVEIFLPWSMLAMPHSDGHRHIGIWLKRQIAHLNEIHSWPPLPTTETVFLSGFQRYKVEGISPRQQVAFFPYVSTTMDDISSSNLQKLGLDLSYRPIPSVQIAATLNPDFGSAESDRVVVNLTAFETFFPEKRLFFLEGNEVFFTTPRSDINRYSSSSRGQGARRGQLGYVPEPTTLLNTRRIGGAARHLDVPEHLEVRATELSKPTDLKGALKVVGSQGRFLFGSLFATEDQVRFDAKDSANEFQPLTYVAEGRDFGAVRLLYEATKEGRTAFGYLGTFVDHSQETPTVHGIDAHILSPDGKFHWDGQYAQSHTEAGLGRGMFNDFTYVPEPGWFFSAALDYFDSKLEINDLGFIQRNDLIQVQLGGNRMWWSGLPHHRSIRTSLFLVSEWNTAGFNTRSRVYFGNNFEFKDASQIRASLSFGGARWDDRSSRDNGMFKEPGEWMISLGYGTDSARKLSYSGGLRLASEPYGGFLFSGDAGASMTISDRLTLDFDLRYTDQSNWLLHIEDQHFATFSTKSIQPILTVDLFFSARQHLRLTYHGAGYQAFASDHYSIPTREGELIPRANPPPDGDLDFTISRMTMQLRYRWEIKPLSDLFLVYTRGAQLPSRQAPEDIEFESLFRDAFRDPIVDVLLFKLRYRFGT